MDMDISKRNLSVREVVNLLFCCKDPIKYASEKNRITLKDLTVSGTNPGEILLYIYMTGAAMLFGTDRPINKLTEDQKKTMNLYMRCIDVEAKFLSTGSEERLEFHPLSPVHA